MARSRSPSGLLAGGASSSRPNSADERKCGSERLLRGLRSGLAGFDLVQPSRWPKRKKLRSEARRRAIVVLAKSASCRLDT